MEKQPILDLIIKSLQAELASLTAAAKDAREYATDSESKAEDKYDTRATESSYLADGQGRLAAEVAESIEAFQALAARTFRPEEPIALGALVEIERPGGNHFFFLGPRAGGLTVVLDKREISVVTPQSPLGQRLLGKVEGGGVTMPTGRQARIVRVA